MMGEQIIQEMSGKLSSQWTTGKNNVFVIHNLYRFLKTTWKENCSLHRKTVKFSSLWGVAHCNRSGNRNILIGASPK